MDFFILLTVAEYLLQGHLRRNQRSRVVSLSVEAIKRVKNSPASAKPVLLLEALIAV